MMTVRQLQALLANADPDATVLVGVLDDEANLAGGVFVEAEEIIASDPGDNGHPWIQLSAWTDLKDAIS